MASLACHIRAASRPVRSTRVQTTYSPPLEAVRRSLSRTRNTWSSTSPGMS